MRLPAIRTISWVCAAVTVAAAEQQSAGGFGTVLWSVLAGCLNADSTEPTAVCIKSRALFALDRALARPAVVVADGISLATRAGKSLPYGDLLQAEKVDRAVLDTAKDSDHKSALLDDMLVNRLNDFMSTRSIVLDELTGQEGRSRKKEEKGMQQAIIMVVMLAVAMLGPMAFGFVAMLVGKAILVGKIALVVSSLMALQKQFEPQEKKIIHTSVDTIPNYYNGVGDVENNVQFSAHNMAYSQQI